MDRNYISKGCMYFLNDFISEEGFKQIAATGAYPLNDEIKTKLKIIEYIYPRFSEAYRKFQYVDEVWYLDKLSVAGGNTHAHVLPRVVPGFDIGAEYERGERPYSRFGIIGPEENPERIALWSPDALIEIFDEFVISAQAPVYWRDRLIGKISIHYNLDLLNKDKIANPVSNGNILLVTNSLTLVGMSAGAKQITRFTEYKKQKWESKQAKMIFVEDELNLAKQNNLFGQILKTLEPGKSTKSNFSGKEYQVFKAEIPEIRFQVIALV